MNRKLFCIIIVIFCFCGGGYMLYNHFTHYININDNKDTENQSVIEQTEISRSASTSNNEELEETLSTLLAQCLLDGQAVADLENASAQADSDNIDQIITELRKKYISDNASSLLWLTPALTINYSWSFIQPYEVNDDGSLFVRWLCYDDSQNLLAYTVADYADGCFQNLRTYTTSFGVSAINNYSDYSEESVGEG